MLMAHFVLYYERKGYIRYRGYFEIIMVTGYRDIDFIFLFGHESD